MKGRLEIKPVDISENYAVISGMMLKLHEHEQSLWSRTAKWADIEFDYMLHVINMQREADGTCLVAYVDGTPAGFIFGYVEEQDESRIEDYLGKELYVSDGYVAPEFRGHGVYGRLNEDLESIYVGKGVKRICRFTLVNNARMQNILEQNGYKVTRLLYEKWL